MLVIQPRMIRISPRISTLPPPPGPTFTRNESRRWADRTLLVPTPRCQPNLATTSAFPTAHPESNRSAWSRPEDPLSQDATTVRHTARSTRTCQMGRLVVSVQGLPVSAAMQLTCEAMWCRLVCWEHAIAIGGLLCWRRCRSRPSGRPTSRCRWPLAGRGLLRCFAVFGWASGGRARARHRAALEEFAAGTRSRPREVPEARWGDDAGVS
jgi:hypothetical protein